MRPFFALSPRAAFPRPRLRGRGARRGSALVEAAIVTPLLMLLVIGILEMGMVFFTKITLESAVRQATRFAVTGNTREDADNPGSDLPRPDGIKQYLVEHATGIQVDKSKITITPADGGGPGQVVKVTAEHTYRFATPLVGEPFGGEITFRHTSTMKNEPVFTAKRRS